MTTFTVKFTEREEIETNTNYINNAEEIEIVAENEEEAIELAKQHYIDCTGEEPTNLEFWIA